MEPPPVKKQKQNAKKSKTNVNDRSSIYKNTKIRDLIRVKNAQLVFLENPELVQLTMWTSFEKAVSPLIELLLHETNQYANRDKNNPQFKVALDELKNFIGLIFLSGYKIRLPERDYWSVGPDFRCKTFCETMKSFFHATGNQSLIESRIAKVEPLYNILKKKIQQFGITHEDLIINESMVPYYSHHSCKQFMRAKPICFGCKLWVLASVIH